MHFLAHTIQGELPQNLNPKTLNMVTGAKVARTLQLAGIETPHNWHRGIPIKYRGIQTKYRKIQIEYKGILS